MQASPSTAERLKARLVGCLDKENNVIDMVGFVLVLEELESATMTKEALEATRLGALVNDLRRKLQTSQGDLSKRCRSIIRAWQKLCVASSIGGTGAGSTTTSPASAKSDGARTTPDAGLSVALQHRLTAGCTAGRVISSPSYATRYEPKGLLVNGHRNLRLSKTQQQQLSPVIASDELVPTEPKIQAPSLKIRIKMGGELSEASIIKSTSVPNALNSHGEYVAATNGTASRLEGATLDSCLVLAAIQFPTTGDRDAEEPLATNIRKKPRQKRNLDEMMLSTLPDHIDPLDQVSQGRPLPKLKSTADLVAEMAVGYPEHMARSMANAAAVPAEARLDNIAAEVDAHETHARRALHDDHLKLSKADLVARFLKSSSHESPPPLSPCYLAVDAVTTHKLKTNVRTSDPSTVVQPILTADTESAVPPPTNPAKAERHNWYADLLNSLEKNGADATDADTDAAVDADSGRTVIYMDKSTAGDGLTRESGGFGSRWPDLDSRLLINKSSTTEHDRPTSPALVLPYVDVGAPDFLQFKLPPPPHGHLAHWSER